MPKAMHHLNGNIMCAIDIETTGSVVGTHDIWQIAVVPLDSFYKPIFSPLPFTTILRPHNKEESERKYVSQENLSRAVLRGNDPYKAGDVFEKWFINLNLPDGKKIMPLAHDWCFKKPFIENWLFTGLYRSFFHDWYRDLIPVSLYANDSAEDSIEQVPYPKSLFSFLMARLQVEWKENADCMAHCVALAEGYKRALRRLF
jgi:hypothetical protein